LSIFLVITKLAKLASRKYPDLFKITVLNKTIVVLGYTRSSLSSAKMTVWNGKSRLIEIALKGHGNEADFLGFLQKLVPHRFLTLPFKPFQFWLRIHGDIHNRKTTPRLASRRVIFWMFKRKLGESQSWQLSDSASGEVAMESRGVNFWIFLK
jgi:hypothetical protein